MHTLRAAVITALIVVSALGLPCCTVYNEKTPVTLDGENAIIVWNAEKKIEHFVRQADFGGEADDFGFIVPTPTVPTVAEANEEVFNILANLDPFRNEPTASSEVDAVTAASVELIEQYEVGDFEASILKATNGEALNEWLKANGYSSRPAMTEWLDHYAKINWHFAALKLIRARDAQGPRTKAVRVSFQTDVPFYPFKMPVDTWPEGHYRPIRLYFIAEGVARGKYRGRRSEWRAKIDWSAPLDLYGHQRFADALGIAVEDIPKDATVTAFMNTDQSTDYSNDVYFLTYNSVVPTWLLASLAVTFLVFLFYQFKKRLAHGRNSVELSRSESQSVSQQ